MLLSSAMAAVPFLFLLTASATTKCPFPPLSLPIHPSFPFPNSSSHFLALSLRDTSRLLYLTSLAATRYHPNWSPIASGYLLLHSTNYVIHTSIGTPPQPLLASLDISSDTAWFPCISCLRCPSSPVSPFFSPSLSSSFHTVPCLSPLCSHLHTPLCSSSSCAFNLSYGSSSIFATLSQDSLLLSPNPVSFHYTFGCVHSVTGVSMPPHGHLGLGRGPLSFLSQTHSIYSSVFSYCLPSFRSPSFSGTLRLGPSGQPRRIRKTRLLLNPHRPSLYYVNMTGIRVGRKRLPIQPSTLAFDPKTGAGTVFDSGTMFSRLVSPAYAALRDEFRRRVKGRDVSSLGGFDTCYRGPAPTVPTITFEFEGMNMTLTEENTMIHGSSGGGGVACLAMAASPGNMNSVLNVIASFQQQNHRVLFDVAKTLVGVSRELCTT